MAEDQIRLDSLNRALDDAWEQIRCLKSENASLSMVNEALKQTVNRRWAVEQARGLGHCIDSAALVQDAKVIHRYVETGD